MSTPTPAMRGAALNPVNVTIIPVPGGPPKVLPRERHVLDTSEEIVWTLGGPANSFRVVFKGQSPFSSKVFDNVNSHSGAPIVKPGATHYKYEVSVDGGPVLDPDVIIDPNTA